jgi:hypothetical protein
MKHNGLTFRKNRRYGFRLSDPTKDFDSYGRPVERNYVSFVRIKECEIYERDGRKYYNAENAKSISVVHGGTNYGYGVWKHRNTARGKWIRNDQEEMVYVYEYMQCTVYLAIDGVVYTSSLFRTVTDHFKKMKK